MNILITGGAGNLACQLTHELPADARITLADIAPAPIAPVRAGCRFVRTDLTDPEALDALFREAAPQRVIHLASLLSGSTEKNRRLGWTVNATASLDLLERCLAHRVERVLFPSSLAVWGGKLPDPLPEDYETWPEGLYGVTKVAVERLGHYYHRAHGLDFRGIRLPVIVSPHAPDGAASAYASHAFRAALRGEAYRFKVRPDTRVSMMYVKDCLRALAGLLAADPARLTRRVYNVHAISPSARELAEAVRERVPGADIGFAPEAAVADLIDSWPAVIGDGSARRDWDWRPAWDLPALAADFGGGLSS
jgi:threonine 3-dehydrogenase